MDETPRTYCCIDLKSFYASVECVDRKWDPFEKNLVVADPERTEKTICLAVSPAMKALGVPGRCRVFEIPEGIEYFMAKPRMRLYMEVSAKIVSIYLRFVSAADLHVYSIDECFIDLTPYLSLYKTSAKALVDRMRAAVYEETGASRPLPASSNLFLAKVALDITASTAKTASACWTKRASSSTSGITVPSPISGRSDAVSLRGSRALAFAILKGWPMPISICSTESSA